MEGLRIWLLCIAAAVVYGIVHDQITARICVEYFSVFHPTILPLKSPTLLGLQWGILATWWVGAALGVPLAIAARAGSHEPLSMRNLYLPLGLLFGCMALGAFLAGSAGFVLAKYSFISSDWLSPLLPPERHARFMADWWAHSASYIVGILGGITLCIWTYRRRKRIPCPDKE